MKSFKFLIQLFFIVVIATLIRNYIFSPIIVDGYSMNETLEDGDFMLLEKYAYIIGDIERFDIVVIKGDVSLVKRVIGLPGETVSFHNNKLYIDNKLVSEDFLSEGEYTGNLTYFVPEGEYFVLGDNRSDSEDSRVFGSIKYENIIGKTRIIINRLKIAK